MAYSINLLPEAETDIEDALMWYNDINSTLRIDFLLQVREAFLSIHANPFLFQKITMDYHKLNLVRFPYKVIYTVQNEQILIIAVAHHKRSNKHWISRK